MPPHETAAASEQPSRPPAPGARMFRSVGIAMAAVALLLLAGVSLLRRGRAGEAIPLSSAASAGPASVEIVSSGGPATPSASVQVAPPSGASAPQPLARTVPAGPASKHRSAPAPTTSKGVSPSCYALDSAGFWHVKPECL